jgi:predicted house-cleaning noncanonical NTP pyrophosphatase (MazG superfamily)
VEEILEEEEFKCFSKNKWVIQHAAVKHSKPKKFLRTVKETVEEILEDKEFERFKNSLGIVLKAVVWHSSDPKDFLRSQPTSSL